MLDRFTRSAGFAFGKKKAVFVSRVRKDSESFGRFEQLERLDRFEQFPAN